MSFSFCITTAEASFPFLPVGVIKQRAGAAHLVCGLCVEELVSPEAGSVALQLKSEKKKIKHLDNYFFLRRVHRGLGRGCILAPAEGLQPPDPAAVLGPGRSQTRGSEFRCLDPPGLRRQR